MCQNDEFCIKDDEFCRQPRHFVDGLTFSSPYARPGSLVVTQRSDLMWSEISGAAAGTE